MTFNFYMLVLSEFWTVDQPRTYTSVHTIYPWYRTHIICSFCSFYFHKMTMLFPNRPTHVSVRDTHAELFVLVSVQTITHNVYNTDCAF